MQTNISSKEKNLKFIKDFSKIKISNICKELNIDKSNLWRGTLSNEKIEIIKNEIIKKYEEIKKDHF